MVSVFLEYECLGKHIRSKQLCSHTSDQIRETVAADLKQALNSMHSLVLKHVRMQFTIQCKYALHDQCCHRGCYGRCWYFFKNRISWISCVGSKNIYIFFFSKNKKKKDLIDSDKGQIVIGKRLCQSIFYGVFLGMQWFLQTENVAK